MSKFKGVVFDLEDTLYDKADWIVPAIEYAAGLFGLDATRTLELIHGYQQQRGCIDSGIFNHVLIGCGQFDTAMNVRALSAWANQYQPSQGSLQLFPGVMQALAWLGQRFKMAIVTDGPVKAQKMKVDAVGITPIIPTVVFSDEIAGLRSRLPDPRGVLAAADELRIQPGQMIWVADNPMRDFVKVKACGITTVQVHTGEFAAQEPPSAEHAADYDISSVARLPALLEELHEASTNDTAREQTPRLTLISSERRL